MLEYKLLRAPEINPDQKARIVELESRIAENAGSGKYGFVNVVKTNEYLQLAQQALNNVEWAKTIVVIGIGGSDLGARTIENALGDKSDGMEVLFFGDSTDPNALDSLLRSVDLGSTVFNIVSKSGSTLEIIAYYSYLKSIYQSRSSSWQKHFIFSTDSENGGLKSELNKYEDVIKLPIPSDVGGRYSVLSVVGLLPALAMGVDAQQMLAGANSIFDNLSNHSTGGIGDTHISVNLAAKQYAASLQGKSVSVFWPYSARLKEFGRWYRQLWAETLGKDGKGILPVSAIGPADQHSQLQFYTQGADIASYDFLKVRDHGSSHIIKNIDIEGFEYLAGKDFAEIINAELDATSQSLVNSGRYVGVLEVDQLTAYTLGELFMAFEIGVVALADLLGVNPFDQPGVEESKRLVKEILSTSN